MIDTAGKMPYTNLVETHKAGRCFLKPSVTNSPFAGKAPSIGGLTSMPCVSTTTATSGGRFAMPPYKKNLDNTFFVPKSQPAKWQANVYKKASKENMVAGWAKLRAAVFYRDSYTCIRCDKRFPAKQLTAHHVIPRVKGGPDTMSNLVTLCEPCHDFVECGEYYTRTDIIGSMPEDLTIFGLENQEVRKDWHTWVYGGAKGPR